MNPERYLYHCTEFNHGETLAVQRRCPFRSDKEPETPRLCVSPSIAACFAARLFSNKVVYVYRTPKPKRGITPRNVWDDVVTGERWLIPPDSLELIQTIPASLAWSVTKDIWRFHRTTKSKSSLTLRVCQYALAHEAFGGPAWQHRLIRRFLWRLNIDDPLQYIESRCQKVA